MFSPAVSRHGRYYIIGFCGCISASGRTRTFQDQFGAFVFSSRNPVCFVKQNVPAAEIISVLEAVTRRTPTKINSFKYFVKEITTQPDPRNRAWQKELFEKIVYKVRDISVGRSGYSMADFVEDIKCSCAREGVPFDNDVFNELVG